MPDTEIAGIPLVASISAASLVEAGGATGVPSGQVLAVPRENFDLPVDTEQSSARALLGELASRLVQARTGH
jgi:hypothetical protein